MPELLGKNRAELLRSLKISCQNTTQLSHENLDLCFYFAIFVCFFSTIVNSPNDLQFTPNEFSQWFTWTASYAQDFKSCCLWWWFYYFITTYAGLVMVCSSGTVQGLEINRNIFISFLLFKAPPCFWSWATVICSRPGISRCFFSLLRTAPMTLFHTNDNWHNISFLLPSTLRFYL